MGLRPGRTVRNLKRPYTRISQKVPRKSYVVGVPYPKLHQFEMGDKTKEFDTILYLVADEAVQMRDNAMEAARVVANKFLDSKIGPTNYFMKILVYPHQVIREKPIATGAGADRYSQGMRLSFGKPTGHGIITKKGMRLVMLRVMKKDVAVAKQALKKYGLKLATKTRIILEE